MISWHDLYTVLAAMVPLYVAMILAYGSVRWWGIFTPDQCSGINRFVAVFAVPLLSFHFISSNDPYAMNLRFIAADTLQKLIVLGVLALWTNLSKTGSLEWMITVFSLNTLPNTLVMGIPLLIAMYGPYSGSLMVQVVVLQCIVWYTLLLFLFEFRGAKLLIMEQFPETGGSIVSFRVDSDVVSLDGRDPIETEAAVGDDGRIHVVVRKSNVSRRSLTGRDSTAGRPSNLTGAEIYSLSSTPRGSNFHHGDFYSMMGYDGAFLGRPSNFGAAEVYSRGVTPRPSNFEEGNAGPNSPRFGYYPAPNPEFGTGPAGAKGRRNAVSVPDKEPMLPGRASKVKEQDANELHMFVWSSNASPGSEVAGLPVFGGGNVEQSGRSDGAKEIRMLVSDHTQNGEGKAKRESEVFGGENFTSAASGKGTGGEDSPGGAPSKEAEDTGQAASRGGNVAGKQMPPASVITRLILIMVWRKLIRNPNTYSSLIGLVWSLIAFRWHLVMPAIVAKSISILSDAGLGMAMFSLGLFMALQPKMISCGNKLAAFSMAVRFITGPAVMAIASIIIGLRGDLLRVAIVQAALPQGIVPFVFAKEYNNHPAVLSTAVIFGMLIALPIDLVYYILLGV